MNKSELVKILSTKINMDPKIAEKMINSFGATITDALSEGDKVVYSNFGTFYTVHYPSKVIYHPVLGAKKKMVMLPTNVVKWMPSGNIKDMVNTGKDKDIESATVFGATKKLRELKEEDQEQKVEKVEDDLPISNSVGLNLDSSGNKVEEKVEEEEEIEIPIRKLTKKIEPEIKNEPEKPVETTDKTGFWEHLFNKTGGSASPEEKKVENPIEEVPAEKDEGGLAPQSSKDKVGLVPQNSKSEAGPSVGIGMFSDQAAENKTPETSVSASASVSTGVNPDGSPDGKGEIPKMEEKEPVGQEEDIAPFTNRKTPISYVDLSKSTIPKEIIQRIPEKVAREYRIVPIDENEKELTIGMIDPEDIEAIEIVKKIVGKTIVPKLTTETDLNHVLDQYQGFETEVKEAIESVSEESPKNEDKKDLAISSSDTAPASRIVSSLLKRAVRDKASDIHIEPYEEEVVVRFRIDGVLHKKVSLPKTIQQAVISRVKILSNLKIDEQRLPQDGRFSIQNDNRKIDFRVSTMPIANGEKVVMRILDKLSGIISIDDLGFRKRDLDLVNLYCQKSHGMILVTGPTGSGKTTTLYALIDKIYNEGINIITLEDPIEYQIPGINQSQVNAEIDYTFSSGLRSILRQDPDVVMIGEIRDKETAEMAVHAALTGHVVLSTLHTNDSAGALPRLIDMQIEPFLLNSSLNLVMAQRLARKICESCKEEIIPSPDQVKIIKEELEKMPKSEKTIIDGKLKFFKGKGCKECAETGYKGRIGLYEILEANKNIKSLVAKEASSTEIRDAAIKDGMTTMIQDGIMKANQGLTTIEEVWRVTRE